MKKFELSTETKINWFGNTLYRIKALILFTTITGDEVKAGDFGGYVEKLENLSQDGKAWVWGNAKVCGDARLFRADHLLVIGAIGSRSDFTTFFRDKDNEITVKCGCFCGKIADFLKKVKETHDNSKYAVVYRAAVEVAKLQVELTSSDEEPEKDKHYETI